MPETGARRSAAEDRWAIHDLVGAYDLAVDAQDWGALAELFASTARLGPVEGRDAVVDLLRQLREAHGRTRHVSHHSTTTLDGDRATGVVPASSELDMGGRTYRVAARYLDDYVREDGRWCFERRRTLLHYVLPAEEAGDALSDPRPVRWPGRPAKEADL